MSSRQNISRATVGYLYWFSVKAGDGWRQVGPDALFIVDDFGNLVFGNGVLQ